MKAGTTSASEVQMATEKFGRIEDEVQDLEQNLRRVQQRSRELEAELQISAGGTAEISASRENLSFV